MEGSRYSVLYGSVGSERILSRVQAGRDVVFDVLESQFLDTAEILGTGKMMAVSRREGNGLLSVKNVCNQLADRHTFSV